MRRFFFTLALLGLTTGCVNSSNYAAPYRDYAGEAEMAAGEPSTGASRRATEPAAPPHEGLRVAAVADEPEVIGARRVMIYNVAVRLVVLNIANTQRDIRAKAEAAGGYLLSLDGQTITVRVPADRMNATLDYLQTLGEVTDRQMTGEDVTDQLRDLNIRLANAQQARSRLLELVAKAQKTEDVLKIEKELTRLTEQIETLKGKLAMIGERVRFATITIQLNSPLAQRQLAIQIPFPWVRDLAGDLIAGTSPAHVSTGVFKPGLDVDLPDSYIRYIATPNTTRAMSADGVLIKVERHENYDGGDMDFWATLCRRSLVEHRAISLSQSDRIQLPNDREAQLYVGAKQIGGDEQHCVRMSTRTSRYVYTFEAWGPAKVFEADRTALMDSARSLNVR